MPVHSPLQSAPLFAKWASAWKALLLLSAGIAERKKEAGVLSLLQFSTAR
jgi:hypothetical protein